jgi:dTDP-4-dehydrorhamnose reductase
MRVLLLGGSGQVGSELARSLAPLGEITAPVSALCDATNLQQLEDAVRAASPDIIVNAAAYTAVDRAEDEPRLAHAVNAEAPGLLGRLACELDASLVHYSTDYVFDGRKDGAYEEVDATNPLSTYGRSKLAGETNVRASGCAHLILRTSWVYASHGHNFVRTMLRLAREKHVLSVVNDQIGSPTWARAIAEATTALLARAGRDRVSVRSALAADGGVFHLTAAGVTSWHAFASAIFESVPDPRRTLVELRPITSAEYSTRATRPANSRLSCQRLERVWQIKLPDWKSSFHLAARDFELV